MPYGWAIIALLPVILGTCLVIYLLPLFLPLLTLTAMANRADVARAVTAVVVLTFAAALDVLGLVLYLRWVPLIPR